jgi:hypothetical protein
LSDSSVNPSKKTADFISITYFEYTNKQEKVNISLAIDGVAYPQAASSIA